MSNNKKGNKPDAETMGGNTLLMVTQKECVPYGHILLQLKTSNMASRKYGSHQRDFRTFCRIGV